MTPFRRPPIDLYPAEGKEADLIRSLPELIEFNSNANPDHLFCIQALKGAESIRISNRQLRNAVASCGRWLQDNVAALQLPAPPAGDQKVQKGGPVALLMDSDVGLFFHQMALIGLGVPVIEQCKLVNQMRIKMLTVLGGAVICPS